MPLTTDHIPDGYVSPQFPTLDLNQIRRPPEASALYYVTDIWRFTLAWTLILYAAFHIGAGALAVVMVFANGKGRPLKQRVAWRYVWTLPIPYLVVAGIEGMFAGSVVGLVLGAVYFAGGFHMSTGVPFVWGWINVLVLVVSSFSVQGFL